MNWTLMPNIETGGAGTYTWTLKHAKRYSKEIHLLSRIIITRTRNRQPENVPTTSSRRKSSFHAKTSPDGSIFANAPAPLSNHLVVTPVARNIARTGSSSE